MADDKKIIFSMVGVSKSFQNNKSRRAIRLVTWRRNLIWTIPRR